MPLSFLKAIFRRARPSNHQPPRPNTPANCADKSNDFYAEGVLSAKMGHLDRALQLFENALAGNPSHYLAYVGIGNLLYLKSSYAEAVSFYEKALELQPDSPALLINYGNALRFLGHPQAALPLVERAIGAVSHNPEYLANLALVYQDLGRLEDAERFFREAVHLSPSHIDARLHLALLHLLRGRFDLGWPDYELRLEKNDPSVRKPPYEKWTGQKISKGALLIYAEQGVGDEIMFASCINDVLHNVDKCVVECSPKLAGLFQRSFPAAIVIGGNQRLPVDLINCPYEISFATPIGSLPLLFRKSAHDFPTHSGFLQPNPERVTYWQSRLDELGSGLKIGISWFGGTPKTRGHLRSISLDTWTPLLDMPKLKFISLQHGANPNELDAVFAQAGRRIHHWPGVGDDLDETAAVIANLDLVISVQNTVVHLSGALGRPTWALVPICPEWRYLAHGEVMPWYPSVRIFRQTQLGDWNDVFSKIIAAISHWTSESA